MSKNHMRITVLVFLVLFMIMASGCAAPRPKRVGMVIGIEKENIPEYIKLHDEVWPGVRSIIAECNIWNYSIYLAEVEKDKYYLFSYFEYHGDDFKADMAKMVADKTMQKWWKLTDPLQVPVPTRKKGEWWSVLEEAAYVNGDVLE